MLEQLLLVSLIVFTGGLLKGFAGFGYAVLSIGLLSFMYSSSEAIILMIVPLIIGNLVLIREVKPEKLEDCVESFLPFIIAVLIGSAAGVLMIGSVPERIFSVGIGVFLIAYSASRADIFRVHMELLRKNCFRRGQLYQIFSGSLAGFIFGSMSIGALTVSYLQSIELERKTFVGLLSFVLFIISGLRIGLSWLLGYYTGNNLLILSFIAGFPGLVGVILGSKFREYGEEFYSGIVLVLFAVIGLKLIIG